MATKPAESSAKSVKSSKRARLELMLPPEVKAQFETLARTTDVTKDELFAEMLKRWTAAPAPGAPEKPPEKPPAEPVEQEKPSDDRDVYAHARRLLFAYGAHPTMARRALQKEIDAETGEKDSWKVSGSEAGIRYNRINNALISLGYELEQDDDVPEFLRLNGIQSDDLSTNIITTQLKGKQTRTRKKKIITDISAL